MAQMDTDFLYKNNKNTQQYFQEAFGFTLFAVILCPRASSLS